MWEFSFLPYSGQMKDYLGFRVTPVTPKHLEPPVTLTEESTELTLEAVLITLFILPDLTSGW